MLAPTLRVVARQIRRHPTLARWVLQAMPDWRREINVPGVGPMEIRLRRHRALWLRPPLQTEAFPLALIRSVARPGDVVFDIGANVGFYSRCFVSLFDAARVFAFEPMSENRDDLNRNIKRGGMHDRVAVMPYAACDLDGEEEFQIDNVMSASASLDRVLGGRAATGRHQIGLPPVTEVVQCRRLDSLIDAGEVDPPDLVKIDVEGAELLVLKGAEDYISRRHPRLFLELHGADKACSVLQWLFDAGYFVVGKTKPHVIDASYGLIGPRHLDRIRGPYDVTHVVASIEKADLPTEDAEIQAHLKSLDQPLA